MHRMVVYMMRVPTHSTTLIEETKKVKKVLMMTRMNYRCCCGFCIKVPLDKRSKGLQLDIKLQQVPLIRACVHNDKLMHYDSLLFACIYF